MNIMLIKWSKLAISKTSVDHHSKKKVFLNRSVFLGCRIRIWSPFLAVGPINLAIPEKTYYACYSLQQWGKHGKSVFLGGRGGGGGVG